MDNQEYMNTGPANLERECKSCDLEVGYLCEICVRDKHIFDLEYKLKLACEFIGFVASHNACSINISQYDLKLKAEMVRIKMNNIKAFK